MIELSECPECGRLLSGVEDVKGKDYYICSICGPVAPAPGRRIDYCSARVAICLDDADKTVIYGVAGVSGRLLDGGYSGTVGNLSVKLLEATDTRGIRKGEVWDPEKLTWRRIEPERVPSRTLPILDAGRLVQFSTPGGPVTFIIRRIDVEVSMSSRASAYVVELQEVRDQNRRGILDGSGLGELAFERDVARMPPEEPAAPESEPKAVEENRFVGLAYMDLDEGEKK